VRDGRVKSVDTRGAGQLMHDGWVLLDVRPPTETQKVSIVGAVQVPLFLPETRNDLPSVLKRASTWGTGGWWLGGTHMNPNPGFMQEVGCWCWCCCVLRCGDFAAAADDNGRSPQLDATQSFDQHAHRTNPTSAPHQVTAKVPRDAKVIVGCQRGLRSLAACEQLSRAGYRTLAWVNGGFDAAEPGDLVTVPDGKDIRWVGGWGGGLVTEVTEAGGVWVWRGWLCLRAARLVIESYGEHQLNAQPHRQNQPSGLPASAG